MGPRKRWNCKCGHIIDDEQRIYGCPYCQEIEYINEALEKRCKNKSKLNGTNSLKHWSMVQESNGQKA